MATIVDDLRQYMNISQEYMLSSHIHGNIIYYYTVPLTLWHNRSHYTYNSVIMNHCMSIYLQTTACMPGGACMHAH